MSMDIYELVTEELNGEARGFTRIVSTLGKGAKTLRCCHTLWETSFGVYGSLPRLDLGAMQFFWH